MKGTTVAAFMLIVAGAIMTGAAFMIVRGDISKFNSPYAQYEERSYTCTDEVDSIQIRETSGSIEFVTGDVDRVTVSYSDKKDESVYEIREDGGNLTIEKKAEKRFLFFHIDFSEHLMTVTLPKNCTPELDIVTTSGSLRGKNVTGKNVSIKNTSGSVKLENVTSDSDLEIKNTSGSISLEDVEVHGDVDASLTSGSIKLDRLKADGDITLTGVSGSIKGTIDGKESDYKIRAGVTSGSCNLKDTNEGSKALNVKTTSGSIRIEFLQ